MKDAVGESVPLRFGLDGASNTAAISGLMRSGAFIRAPHCLVGLCALRLRKHPT